LEEGALFLVRESLASFVNFFFVDFEELFLLRVLSRSLYFCYSFPLLTAFDHNARLPKVVIHEDRV
jgi:hypothetical protein